MATKVLELDDIEQGRFIDRMRRAVRTGSQFVAAYIERHGQSAVGGRYGVSFKFGFYIGDRGRVDIVTYRVGKNEPGEPGETTIARACMFGEGQYDLFVPVSGSSSDPEQAKLFAEDGRTLE